MTVRPSPNSRLLDDVFPKGVRARVVESMARRSRLQQAQALADTIRGGGRRASADTSAEKDDEVLVEAGLVPTLAAGGGGGGGGAPPPPPRSGALLAIQKFVGLEARIAEPARASVASSLLGRGVADAFPSVSVVFSDVVGFTSWSSTVAPEAVFAYLCALFGAFDKMGARHGAYKSASCRVTLTKSMPHVPFSARLTHAPSQWRRLATRVRVLCF